MQADQVEGIVNAVSEAALIANQYMAGFMAVILLLMVLSGVAIAVIISRAVTKLIDSGARGQQDDSSLQLQMLHNWSQDRAANREVAQSVGRLTDKIEPFVTSVADLLSTLTLSTQKIVDSNTAVAGSVSIFSEKLDEFEDLVKRAADCKSDTDQIIQAINDAADRIIKLIPPPPPPAADAPEGKDSPLDTDAVRGKATMDDLPKSS